MSTKTTIRTDGEFGPFYALTTDVRAVVAMYRASVGYSYRQAWATWFDWALWGQLPTAEARGLLGERS